MKITRPGGACIELSAKRTQLLSADEPRTRMDDVAGMLSSAGLEGSDDRSVSS